MFQGSGPSYSFKSVEDKKDFTSQHEDQNNGFEYVSFGNGYVSINL